MLTFFSFFNFRSNFEFACIVDPDTGLENTCPVNFAEKKGPLRPFFEIFSSSKLIKNPKSAKFSYINIRMNLMIFCNFFDWKLLYSMEIATFSHKTLHFTLNERFRFFRILCVYWLKWPFFKILRMTKNACFWKIYVNTRCLVPFLGQ